MICPNGYPGIICYIYDVIYIVADIKRSEMKLQLVAAVLYYEQYIQKYEQFSI